MKTAKKAVNLRVGDRVSYIATNLRGQDKLIQALIVKDGKLRNGRIPLYSSLYSSLNECELYEEVVYFTPKGSKYKLILLEVTNKPSLLENCVNTIKKLYKIYIKRRK